MSNWTHVAAIVRIDCIRFSGADHMDFDKIFGKERLWGAPKEVWDEYKKHPDHFLPSGSEGTLQKSVWENPDIGSITSYTVSIFGDLRDHDDPNAIIEWFKQKVDPLPVRQAIITVRNAYNGTVNWVYESSEDE